ncbi:hypothetical protein MLD38_001292 [Melastoma candidum]|uniref:Uncharacterized protein n=1 Tax=Melastoma candidum TaxID=119954 RepID=A0ACB9SCW6_9MYRT|nr:hypothetical protein MLD38_001292 [Melastoma candidum]
MEAAADTRLVVEAATPTKGRPKGMSRRGNPRESSPSASENKNPNFPQTSPGAVKSAKVQKSAPRTRIRERKFIVARKSLRKDGEGTRAACLKCEEKFGGNARKCLCVAYENLRASQEEFFKVNEEDCSGASSLGQNEDIEKSLMMHDLENDVGEAVSERGAMGEIDSENPIGVSTIKRRRDKLMEAARNSIPEEGRVMHLVKAFEKLRTIPISPAEDEADKKVVNWALPGLQPPKASSAESEVSSYSFSPSDLLLTAENLGLDSQASLSSSWDSESSRTSIGHRSSRRNSLDSHATGDARRPKKKHHKITNLKPFNLRTEQRGRLKEEEFTKKLQEMTLEEEKQRIPIAQGLPWTTDAPECLLKPPVKENTRPLDLKLHTDLRALERAEFDQQVVEKLNLLEQYKAEKERVIKMEEEEEIKRLRKELVPRAQPMPYFDRPFVPRRSSKNPTVPREPRFHIPQQKKIKCSSSMSWSDMSSPYYSFHQ